LNLKTAAKIKCLLIKKKIFIIIINKFNAAKQSFSNKIKRFLFGITKGSLSSTFPSKNLKFQSYPIIKMLRFFTAKRGFSLLIILSKSYLNYPIYIFYACTAAMLFALLFTIYHIIISYFRINHIISILKSYQLGVSCEAGNPRRWRDMYAKIGDARVVMMKTVRNFLRSYELRYPFLRKLRSFNKISSASISLREEKGFLKLNFNIIIYLVFIWFYFIKGLKIYGLFSIIISFFMSLLISNFVLNNFKFSDYIIVRFLQKVILMSIVMFIGFSIIVFLINKYFLK
jgi:hypothetical protein